MRLTKWQNAAAFSILAKQLKPGDDRCCLFNQVKALFPAWRQDRKIILQGLTDGYEASFIKASDAALQRITCYDPTDMAENIGRDASRIRKPLHDRTMQQILQFAHLMAIGRAYEIPLKRVLNTATHQLATTAGFCRAIVRLCNRWFPDRPMPKLKHDILPIQVGLLLNELLVWPELGKLDQWNWSADRLILRNGAYERRFQELMDRANQPIHESRIADVIDLVSFSNLDEWLEIAREFCWPFYLIRAMLPAELADNAGLPLLVDIWNEFPDDGTNEYYWTIPA